MSVAPQPVEIQGMLPSGVKKGGFVHDKKSLLMEQEQGVPFLRSGGESPEVGHRVELSLIMTTDGGPCRLSGKVVRVLPEPTPRPMRHQSDQQGSLRLNKELGNVKGKISSETKKEALDRCRDALGAVHGQRLICEGRLHFDFEQFPGGPRRCIPFDSRDIWRFTLVANDHKTHLWCVQDDSFENLGPIRPRQWPWVDGSQD